MNSIALQGANHMTGINKSLFIYWSVIDLSAQQKSMLFKSIVHTENMYTWL